MVSELVAAVNVLPVLRVIAPWVEPSSVIPDPVGTPSDPLLQPQFLGAALDDRAVHELHCGRGAINLDRAPRIVDRGARQR